MLQHHEILESPPKPGIFDPNSGKTFDEVQTDIQELLNTESFEAATRLERILKSRADSHKKLLDLYTKHDNLSKVVARACGEIVEQMITRVHENVSTGDPVLGAFIQDLATVLDLTAEEIDHEIVESMQNLALNGKLERDR